MLLMNEIVVELKSFRDLTVMLSSNTKYTFNEYLPMVEGIQRQLQRPIDPALTSQDTINFIKKMKEHFDHFALQEKVHTLAHTASLLDPKYYMRFTAPYVTTLVDTVVHFLSTITPPESQDTVGPSQPPVSVSVKIPKSDR